MYGVNLYRRVRLACHREKLSQREAARRFGFALRALAAQGDLIVDRSFGLHVRTVAGVYRGAHGFPLPWSGVASHHDVLVGSYGVNHASLIVMAFGHARIDMAQ